MNYSYLNDCYKRILITGGAGFIGSNLIRRLLMKTNSLIFNIDKLGYSSDLSSITNLSNANSRHHLLKIDLKDENETHDALKQANPDLIIHLAAESHVDRSIDNPRSFIESNILGTYNLLESTRVHYKSLTADRREKFKFHHVSTDEVYGSLGLRGKFTELTRYSPRSPYSASKAASDHLVNSWHYTYQLPVTITNCSNNYGPYQFPEKLIPLVILKALDKKKIPLYGDGKNIRDWLYVEDHVDAILTAVEKGKIGKSYCIGGNCEKSNIEVVEKICSLLDHIKPAGKPYSNLIEYVKDRPGHDRRYSIDCSLIRKELLWEPKNSFNQGMEKTVRWYLENLDWCERISTKSGYSGERVGIN